MTSTLDIRVAVLFFPLAIQDVMLDEEDQIERDSYDSENTAKRLVPWQVPSSA